MAVPSSSRFKYTKQITFNLLDGTPIETYGTWVPPDFFSDPNLRVTKYTVPAQFAGRPENISNLLYGTPSYFWVLVAYNNPRNPLNWPKVGDVIDVPDIAAIASAM